MIIVEFLELICNMFDTNNNHSESHTSIVMNPPCVGTLQKTHSKSKFKRFHVNSPLADVVFSETPRLSKNEGLNNIVVLQLMCFGDSEILMEYVKKEDWTD